MYDHNSLLIVGILLLGLLAFVEVGYTLGRRMDSVPESMRAQINTIQGSMLGVLALLLGFTFSLALQRYDIRSAAVVEEANAIGTSLLRASLLPEPAGAEAHDLLRDYLQLRVQAASLSLDLDEERAAVLRQSNQTFEALWQHAARTAQQNPNPVTTGLFVQSLNDLIDAYGTRDAALERHVPEVVLFLLFITFLMAACIVGYASGLARHRASFATYILVALIAFLVFIIIDLDRPRRGLIEVSQQPLVSLLESLEQRPLGAQTP